VDDEALRRLRAGEGMDPLQAAMIYLFLENAASVFWLSLFVLGFANRYNNQTVPARLAWRKAAWTGFFISLTYVLVLIAMAYARNVSYVVAFRQISIPLGAILGITILKEPGYRPKIVGVFVIFTGLVLVGIG
jgi:drug/metabolite transporter (DMT)-like permease